METVLANTRFKKQVHWVVNTCYWQDVTRCAWEETVYAAHITSRLCIKGKNKIVRKVHSKVWRQKDSNTFLNEWWPIFLEIFSNFKVLLTIRILQTLLMPFCFVTLMLMSLLCCIRICRIESVSVDVKCAVRGNWYRSCECITDWVVVFAFGWIG